MTDNLTVKEHLRNAALYQPLLEPLNSSDWKRRLLTRYTMQRQLKDALHPKTGVLRPVISIAIPIICLFLVFISYFGLLPLGQWYENIILKNLLNLPLIGLKEILIFAAVVNCLTFLIMKKKFSF